MAASSCDGTQNDCYSDKRAELDFTDHVILQTQPLAKVNLQFSLFPNTSRQLVCWSQPSLTSPLDILNPLIECRKIISSTLISICFKVEASPGEPISDISKGNIVWYSVKLHYITCSVCKEPLKKTVRLTTEGSAHSWRKRDILSVITIQLENTEIVILVGVAKPQLLLLQGQQRNRETQHLLSLSRRSPHGTGQGEVQ